MRHIPLNTRKITDRVHGALNSTARPSAANELAAYLAGNRDQDDAVTAEEQNTEDLPDGTGASTKSAPTPKARAVDPTQGSGGSGPARKRDPLEDALNAAVGGGWRGFH